MPGRATQVPLAALLGLLACGNPEAPPPAPAPLVEPATAPAPVPVVVPIPVEGAPLTPTPRSAGAPVPVELYFRGMSPLHRGFFSDLDALGALGADLGACLTDNAQVWVVWNETERIGHLYLKAVPGVLGHCLPRVGSDALHLEPLIPVGRALAAYRDRVAAKFDFRVSSFRVGITATRGIHQCDLWAAGSHPPDGTTWSKCVGLPDRQACAGPAREGTTRIALAGEDLETVRACFRE